MDVEQETFEAHRDLMMPHEMSWLLAGWLAGWLAELAGWLLAGCWLAAGWLAPNVPKWFPRLVKWRRQASQITIFESKVTTIFCLGHKCFENKYPEASEPTHISVQRLSKTKTRQHTKPNNAMSHQADQSLLVSLKAVRNCQGLLRQRGNSQCQQK